MFDVRRSAFLRQLSALLLEKLPFLAAAVICGLLTIRAENGISALPSAAQFPLPGRLANAILSYVRYPAEMLWPTGLAVFYAYPKTFPALLVAGAFLLLLIVFVCALFAARKTPWLAFGWIWYVVTLLPVIGLLQVGAHSHADRYTYVPFIGLFTVIAWGLHAGASRWRCQAWIVPTAAGLLLLLCVALTREQIGFWRDTETLHLRAIAVTMDNALVHNNLGTFLARQDRLDEAIPHFTEALRQNPDNVESLNNLGVALGRQGRVDDDIRLLRHALELAPDDAGTHCNLGDALSWKGRLDEAIAQYRESIRLKPEDYITHCNLGMTLARQGRLDDAIGEFQKALTLKPDSAEAHCQLGIVLGAKGRLDEAIAHLQDAIRLNPDYTDARNNLRAVLALKTSPARSTP